MDSALDSEELAQQDSDYQDGFDDFTVASSWERLISNIELTCRKWQAAGPKGLLAAGAVLVEDCQNLYQSRIELAYGIKGYQFEYFFKVGNDLGGTDSWEAATHHLQIWFGVRDFLVIAPMSMSGVILDAPEATLLLSAVAIALSNCGSTWPAFVPVHDPTRKAYKGIQGMKGPYSRSFEADRIASQVPVKLMHLEGLHDLFVSKVAFSLLDAAMQSNVKVRFTMRLTYRTQMYGFEYVQNKDSVSSTAEPVANYEGDSLEKVPWDEECPWAEWFSVDDPIKGFELVASWASRLVESSVEMAESENVSTFEADKWSLEPILAKSLDHSEQDEQVSFGSRLRALVNAFFLSKEAQFIEEFAAADKPIIEQVTSSAPVPSPGVLDRVLKEIFREGPVAPGSEISSSHQYARSIKGAPTDSLVAQFCLQALWFGTCNIRAISVLWIEFVREARWCWEELQPLPRISPDQPPNLNTCLLHQKLQLLAACIQRKAAERNTHDGIKSDASESDHESLDKVEVKRANSNCVSGEASEFTSGQVEYAQSSDGEREVEDAKTQVEYLKHNRSSDTIFQIDFVPEHSTYDTYDYEHQRKGSAGPIGHMMLLKSCHRLHAPVTQEPPIMTEDMLIEREQALAALSHSPSGKIAQARLQSDILTSDMAAFKAANPGSVLEDFVRWHSPRDWIENNETDYFVETSDKGMQGNKVENANSKSEWPPKGKLSKRMAEPANAWNEIWMNVKALAASEQKPLFDHTREGEKVIHYLETLRPHQLLAQMVCTAFVAAADILCQTETGRLQPLTAELDRLYLTMASILKPLNNLYISEEHLSENLEDWQTDLTGLCTLFEQVERHVTVAASIYQKISKAPRLLTAIFSDYIRVEKLNQNTFEATPSLEGHGKARKICQVVGTFERETVANLFPPLSSSETWRKSLRMGNFLNGHEPISREVIFSHFDHFLEGQRGRYRIEHPGSQRQILSHRMYIHGTSNDLQVAFSVVSDD